MNRRFLTSAVAIHAGACLIAIVSVGAGAPIANGLMDSSAESELAASPTAIEVNSSSEASFAASPTTDQSESQASEDMTLDSFELRAADLRDGVLELTAEAFAFETSDEPEVISESGLFLMGEDRAADAIHQPASLRSAGR